MIISTAIAISHLVPHKRIRESWDGDVHIFTQLAMLPGRLVLSFDIIPTKAWNYAICALF